MRKILLLTLLACFSGTEAAAEDVFACPNGENAFRRTVHRELRRNCRSCHKAGAEIPPFATASAGNAYRYFLNYTDFAAVEKSVLVERAGNGHCKLPKCDESAGRAMAEAVREWWEQGQQDCHQAGAVRTAALPLPQEPPADRNHFHELRFDLGEAVPELAGTQFSIEVQRFTEPSVAAKGSYRFRRPRFRGGDKAIFVRGVQVLLNGRQLPYGDDFRDIAALVSPVNAAAADSVYPVLSAQTMNLLADDTETDRVQIAFTDLRTTAAGDCAQEDIFTRTVVPQLERNNCMTCHGAEADPAAVAAFDLRGDPATQCWACKQRLLVQGLRHSPLLAIPTRGQFNHPELSAEQRIAYFQALQAWAEAEQ